MRPSSSSTPRQTRPTCMPSCDTSGAQKNLVLALGVYPFEEPGIGPEQVQLRRRCALRDPRGHRAATSPPAAPTISYRVPVLDELQQCEHHPPVISRRDSTRGRREPEPDAELQRHEDRPSHAARRHCSAAASSRQTTRGSLPPSTTRATTARIRRRTASRPKPSSIAIRQSRSQSSTAATSLSPASAMMDSTPTSSRYSICCSSAPPARTRRAASTSTRSRSWSRSPRSAETSRSSESTRRPSVGACNILRDNGDRAAGRVRPGRAAGESRCSTKVSSRSPTRTATAAPSPTRRRRCSQKYALNPELAALINPIVFGGNGPASRPAAPTSPRSSFRI